LAHDVVDALGSGVEVRAAQLRPSHGPQLVIVRCDPTVDILPADVLFRFGEGTIVERAGNVVWFERHSGSLFSDTTPVDAFQEGLECP
jgi:hypothetical protein